MSAYDCYVDSSGCTVCPERPASPGTPTQVITSAHVGWNAGANSITALDGDVHMGDTLDTVPSDAFVGLKQDRDNQTAPYRLEHAFRFYGFGNSALFEIWEGFVQCTSTASFPVGAAYEIRRVQGVVSYYINGVRVYESPRPSSGALIVNACLYTAGDSLP